MVVCFTTLYFYLNQRYLTDIIDQDFGYNPMRFMIEESCKRQLKVSVRLKIFTMLHEDPI